jgi:hypothetical protein
MTGDLAHYLPMALAVVAGVLVFAVLLRTVGKRCTP